MPPLFPGFATPAGTQRFQQQVEATHHLPASHFHHTVDGLALSSLGMGTYLGNPDADTDALMVQATEASLQSGAVNVIDTAINYRAQASERSVGAALQKLLEAGTLQRDEIFVSSKNGYLTPDAAVQEDFRTYVQKNFIQSGLIQPSEIADGSHCMSPAYLDNQLNRSRQNLGLETLDLMYLHNAAEAQLPAVGQEVFMQRLEAAFRFYEQARQENRIRTYGMATWNCFRVSARQEDYLSLKSVVELAEAVGGKDTHGFRFIQLPYNLALLEALTEKTQPVGGQGMTLLEAAHALGIGVFTSVPLMQGQILSQVRLAFEGLETPAQQCLQFVRSTPGVLTSLVGHKQPSHVAENLKVATVPLLSPAQFQGLFAQA